MPVIRQDGGRTELAPRKNIAPDGNPVAPDDFFGNDNLQGNGLAA
jgi:hypothetical protein